MKRCGRTCSRPEGERTGVATIQEALEEAKNPSIRHIVSLSGGKDSAALAIYIRQQYPEIEAEYVFCDTGCELPETYEYLERLQAILGVEVKYISALDMLQIAKKPNRTAFDIYLNELYGGFLPTPRARWCTRVLKIEPFERYVGDSHAFSYIGIRADEDREGYVGKKPPVISERPNIVPVYPFRDDGIRLEDVRRILEESGLGLPDYYRWRSRSGCYFCFYQQRGEWQRLKEEHPDLFERAKGYEKTVGKRRFTWVAGKTLDEIVAGDRRYPVTAPDESEGCAICHL
ncbi:MAG: phosphoadenosine phosphosulfate reductase [Candidatus Dadabacteria bacterium]|nr:MAG: phosphoadenosine phosphosulfate reductase [Candidatus Dadabacteria bacterium]